MSINSLTNLSNSSTLFDKIIEFEKRYVHTLLHLSFPNTPEENGYYYLNGISGQDTAFPLLKFSNSKWDNLRVGVDSSVEINCKWPATGLFNHKGGVFLFTRFPQRQWKRGICSGNSGLSNVANVLLRYGVQHTDITAPYLDSALNSDASLTLVEAIDWNRKNLTALGTTLTKEFALLKTPRRVSNEEYLLVRKTNPCALVYPETQTVSVYYEYLYQEIADLVRKEETLWKMELCHP